MKRNLVLAFSVALVAMFLGTALADQAADSKALVEKGVAMFKEKGAEATIKAIDDPKGPFIKDDLYIFAVSLDNKVLAHPFSKQLVGKDVTETKDKKGDSFFQKFKETAEKKGSGWVEYWWPKPGQQDPSLKNTFIMLVPGQKIYIGAGYYK